MKFPVVTVLACSLLFTGCAITRESTDPEAPTGAPDAAITLQEVQAGYMAAVWS